MRTAYSTATQSPDPSNQNGALLVTSGGHVLAQACNHIPRGVDITPELLADRDWKIPRIAHAEEAVIVTAARYGVRTDRLTMICPWASCLPCARMINIAGIKKLIVHSRRMETTPERFNDPLPGAPKINVNGELWQP